MIISKPYPKLLYLDHNKWVELEGVSSKKDENAKIKSLLNTIKIKIKSNKLKIVANLTNFQETTQRKYKESRMDLAEYVMEFTDGHFFAPYVYLMDDEIRNYFKKKMGLAEIPLRERGMGKGIEFLMGGMPKMKADSIDSKTLEQINKDAKKHFIKNEFILSLFEMYNTVDEEEKERYVKQSESVRKKLMRLPNDQERKKHQININFKNFFMPEIIRAMNAKDISTREGQLRVIAVGKNIPKNLQTYKDRHKFMKSFPLMYANFCLSSYRDRDIKRKVKWNDMMDIVSLCFPIAYFDFVIAEKYFITLARQAKLDELYNTVLLTDLTELNEFLVKI